MLEKLTTTAGGAVPVIARCVFGAMMFFHGLDKLNRGVGGFAEGLAEKGGAAGDSRWLGRDPAGARRWVDADGGPAVAAGVGVVHARAHPGR